MVYKVFDKKSTGSGVAIETNYQLENERHRQIIYCVKLICLVNMHGLVL